MPFPCQLIMDFVDVRDRCPVQDVPICWICLDTARPEAHLIQPCNCPRHAHAPCLARWQLQSAGSRQAAYTSTMEGPAVALLYLSVGERRSKNSGCSS